MKTSPNPTRQIREALSEARGETVTQGMFARELGVSRSLVNALETKASRPISDDFKQRLMDNYGISFAAAPATGKRPGSARTHAPASPVCVAGPGLPLAEALRKHRSQRVILDEAALGAFDDDEIPNMRAALLAAKRAGKAARLYFAVSHFVHAFLHEHALWEGYEFAKKEIALHGGKFPEGSSRHDLQSKLLLSFRELQSSGAYIEGSAPANATIEAALGERERQAAAAAAASSPGATAKDSKRAARKGPAHRKPKQ